MINPVGFGHNFESMNGKQYIIIKIKSKKKKLYFKKNSKCVYFVKHAIIQNYHNNPMNLGAFSFMLCYPNARTIKIVMTTVEPC